MLTLPGGARIGAGPIYVPLVAILSIVTAFLSATWAGPVYGAIAQVVPFSRRGRLQRR
jgi:hypothetical protein